VARATAVVATVAVAADTVAVLDMEVAEVGTLVAAAARGLQMAAGTEVEVAEETGAQAAAAATAVVDMVLRRGATAAEEVTTEVMEVPPMDLVVAAAMVAVVEREVGLQVPRATAAVAATGQQEQVVLVTAQVVMGQGQVGTATLPIPKAQAMVELLLDTELRLPVVLERRMAQLRLERRTEVQVHMEEEVRMASPRGTRLVLLTVAQARVRPRTEEEPHRPLMVLLAQVLPVAALVLIATAMGLTEHHDLGINPILTRKCCLVHLLEMCRAFVQHTYIHACGVYAGFCC